MPTWFPTVQILGSNTKHWSQHPKTITRPEIDIVVVVKYPIMRYQENKRGYRIESSPIKKPTVSTITNISNWKTEGVEMALQIAQEMDLSANIQEPDKERDYPTIRVRGFTKKFSKKGLGPFWSELQNRVPEYWKVDD